MSEPELAEGDDIPHELTEDCWCMPTVKVLDGGAVVVHNPINPRFWPGGSDGGYEFEPRGDVP